MGCEKHVWQNRHDRVLYLLAKAVLESLGLQMLKNMREARGGAGVAGVGFRSEFQ